MLETLVPGKYSWLYGRDRNTSGCRKQLVENSLMDTDVGIWNIDTLVYNNITLSWSDRIQQHIDVRIV